MFTTLKSKIIFFVAIILMVTAAAILYFTYTDVGHAMLRAEEDAARNILRLLELNIKGEYQKLLSDKFDAMTGRRRRLRQQTVFAASVLNEFSALAKDRLISRKAAQEKALDWFRMLALEEETLFVFDRKGRVIAHPDAAIQGTSVASLRDMKGRCIAEVMGCESLKSEGDYAVFSWQDKQQRANIDGSASKKLGFFLPFLRWNWTVAAVVEISDIEAEAMRELEKILAALRMTFANIKVTNTGGVFLFDGKKNMLIPPAGRPVADYASMINLRTGNALLEDFIAAARSDSKSTRYAVAAHEGELVFEAYCAYFKTLDWYIVVGAPVEEIKAPANTLVTRLSVIIALVFFGSLIVAFILVSGISRPLNRLSAYVKQLPSQDFTVAEEGGQTPIDDLPAKSRDEVGRLAESFIFMKSELAQNVRRLMETTAAQERIQSELDVAREIQMGMLPKTFPPFPDQAEFDLYATLKPAKEVGGDLYDFFFIDDDHLCFTVGDVSDKGVPAALFMVITRTLIKNLAATGLSPAEMMARINNLLSTDNPKLMFVTLIVGVLNIQTGEIRYANGGHNPPVLMPAGQAAFFQTDISGPLLGTRHGLEYRQLTLTLRRGESVILYTDGVTESMNPNQEAFSDESLLAEIERLKHGEVKEIIDGIIRRIEQHAESEPQSDDIAIMVIRYNGKDRK